MNRFFKACRWAVTTAACLTLTANIGFADLTTGTLFDADFTTTEGYVDGPANSQAGFNGTASSQVQYVVDTAGSGTLINDSAAFVRAQFGPQGVLSGSTVAVGDMILVEAQSLNITAGDNNARLVFGLSTGAGGGAAQLAIGGQISINGAGDVFVENGGFGVDTANRVDTGFDIGGTFDYGIKLTAESAGATGLASYTIDHLVNGVSLLTETGQTVLPPNAANAPPIDNYLTGFVQDQGGGINFNLDRLTLSTIGTIPEPGSFALLAVAGIACAIRRKR